MFDQQKADRAISFIRKLKHTKGEWAGHLFNLLPWEEKIISDLFGTVNEDGSRQYREAYISVGRKNGKTECAAGMALYALFADGEPGSEIYCAAGDRDQASLVFNASKAMVEQNATLLKNSKILDSTKRIVFQKRNSFYRAISSESYSKHGFNVHVAINDELHVWPNRELYDVLKTGTGARRQPLIINITTAGYDRHSLCYELYTHAKKVKNGIKEDPTFYPAIWELEENDDWKLEENWYKANPGLGIYRSLEEMRESFRRAQDIPAFENTFKRLYLNMWTEQETRFIPMEKWDLLSDPVEDDRINGKLCFAGLDLASTVDIAAFVLVFPSDDGIYDIKPFFFIPEDSMQERINRDRIRYDVWVRQRLIETTPGNVIDYAYILHRIKDCAEKYQLKDIHYDRWGATKLVQDIQDIGLSVVPMGQGMSSMSGPTKELLNLILSGRIRHGGNPVLRWMASNMVVKQDPAGNYKPDKSKSSEKIDGIVALIMGLDGAIRNGNAASVYEARGILTLQ